MTLLEALVDSMKFRGPGVTHAKMVFFAFATNDGDELTGDFAYLSEVELDELVPLLEDWCKARRAEKGVWIQ